eukprot:TRINITY_DN952_c0_g1_i1.p1 TRINITY_DN952_c0_g1~~TRINITY_DN952_c0_g1_i1.p1  ORF type:complete len:185 (+),score=5.26 TRINITY_DN952_c0_g1_i1:80-634(+)
MLTRIIAKPYNAKSYRKPASLGLSKPTLNTTLLRTKRFYSEPAAAPATGARGVTLTIATPTTTVFENKVVDSVVLPGIEGEFEVSQNLAPIITELNPGLVTCISGNERTKYFISGGMVFVNPDSSCSINSVECVPLESLDLEAARQALTEAQGKMGAAQTAQDKAVAEVMVETADAIVKALSFK